jgi:protein MpaA
MSVMSAMSGRHVRRIVLAVTATVGLACGAAPVVAAAHATEGPQTTRFSIGTSVHGRPITVVHRAYPGATRRVVVIGSIHGDERAGLRVVSDLKGRDLPRDLDLWLVRTVNPDGVVADRRTNWHRVDLNRNFPYHWRSINRGTETWSGRAALSEPESRALLALVKKVRPQLVLTFHQPLFGVGANDKGMPVVRALAAGMRLPVKSFSCGSVCYGSFTSWVNHRTPGLAVTVEFGRTASDRRIRRASRIVLVVGAGL